MKHTNNAPRDIERIYVKVTSEIDATGYMQPRMITWNDGRVFDIDRVKDFRPAGTMEPGRTGDCYVVIIHGEEKYLFFERANPLRPSHFGRWFVERMV